MRALERAGANAIVIACNTAHYWHARLQAETALPVLHIADAVCDELQVCCKPAAIIGLLATPGTVEQGFYQQRLQARGHRVVTPGAAQQALILQAIHEVKAGNVTRARAELEGVCAAMHAAGSERLLLACTELPLALAGAPLDTVAIDATAALARAAVAWSLAARRRPDENARKAHGPQMAGGFS
jgi:aspartate racemase